MQQKNIKKIIMGLTLLILITFIINPVTAQNENISISDIKHQLINTETIGTRLAHYFTFWITLTNTGDITSNNITVYLRDPELNADLEVGSFTLSPNKNITLMYEDWPTTLLGDTTLNFTYQPTEQDVETTPYNSGKKAYTFQIGSTNNNTETPGFGIISILIAIFTFLIIKNKKGNEN